MIQVRAFEPPEWNISEILRYARASADDESTAELIKSCIAEAEPALEYKACYSILPLEKADGVITSGRFRSESAALRKALEGCDKALLFAVTLGATFDRLIMRYSRISPSKALMMQAIGAERTEALCDALMDAVSRENGFMLKTRVSPGYGDIPLELQRDIFALLDCPRKIGLTLNESLIMSPSKSVTAIAGIRDGSGREPDAGCASCGKADCIYRK